MASEFKRTRWNREDAIHVLDSWRTSGLSLAAFAKRESIAYPKLIRWKSTLEQTEASSFVPVRIDGLQPSSDCIVTARLTDGTRVSVRGREATDLCCAMLIALRKVIGQ